MSANNRAAGYARVSTNKQEASIPEQRQWIDQAGRREGLTIQATFDEPGIPGDEIASRPALQALLAYCRRQFEAGAPIDTIVVWNLDRFSRADSFATGALMGQLMAYGVRRFLSVEGWTRLDDDSERVLFNLKQDLGRRAYSKTISSNIMRGRLQAAMAGQWPAGAIPYGYRLGPDRHLVLCEKEAEAVRWMFRQYLTRPIGSMLLAEEMNKRGYPLPRQCKGTCWTSTTVLNLLGNEHYTGLLTWNEASRGKYHRIGHRAGKTDAEVLTCHPSIGPSGKPRQTYNAPEEVFRHENAHPAVIDRETFAAVQLKMKDHRAAPRIAGVNPAYPLAGLVRCPECGQPMQGATVVKRNRNRRLTWRKYLCATHRRQGKAGCNHNPVLESELLTAIAVAVRERFSGPDKVEEVRQRLRRQVGRQDADGRKIVQTLERKIKEADSRIATATERLLTIAADHQADADALLRRWKTERQKLVQQLDASRCRAAETGRQEVAIEKALQALQTMPDLMKAAIERKRLDALAEPLRGLIDRIDLRFVHEPFGKAGRVQHICTGGVIHFKLRLGVPATWAWEMREAPAVLPGQAVEVLTTGSTASEAARVLRAAGARRVVVAVLARGTG